MKFFAFLFVALFGLFLALFVISGVKSTLKDIAEIRATAREERTSTHSSRTQSKSTGQVLGESAEEKPIPNFVYPGSTVEKVLQEYPTAQRFKGYFNDVNGSPYVNDAPLYTLFIPVDDAFAALSNPLKAEFASLSVEEKARVVQYHIVPQKMIQVGIPKYGWVQTLSGDMLNFELRKNGGTVGNARILAVYLVDNGVVYIIDRVLVPPEKRAAL